MTLTPPLLDALGLNPPSQLVSVSESGSQRVEETVVLSPQFTRNVEYKIDHISKIKNRKTVELMLHTFQNIAHLLEQKKIGHF